MSKNRKRQRAKLEKYFSKGKYYWRLRDGYNSNILADGGQGYESSAGRDKGYKSARRQFLFAKVIDIES